MKDFKKLNVKVSSVLMSGPYLVVIGAVGAEVRLRTKHLVHHIQAAHGEENHEEEPSVMERAAVSTRTNRNCTN